MCVLPYSLQLEHNDDENGEQQSRSLSKMEEEAQLISSHIKQAPPYT